MVSRVSLPEPVVTVDVARTRVPKCNFAPNPRHRRQRRDQYVVLRTCDKGGGNMIVDVTFEKTTCNVAPARFEAGTGNIADAVGLGAALDYVEQVGMESIAAYEHELLNYATAGLLTVPSLKLIGTAREKAGVLSFVLDDVRTEDVGVALNQEGIAVRAGHHCAQPILRRMGVESTVRPSLALYNTYEDVNTLVAALLRIQAGRGHRGL